MMCSHCCHVYLVAFCRASLRVDRYAERLFRDRARDDMRSIDWMGGKWYAQASQNASLRGWSAATR
jgi:hypothetical protein